MIRLGHEMLRDSARREADRPALICEDRTYTFAQIDQASDRIARALQEAGITRGDRVALFMENSAELVIAAFGVLKAGGVFVMINPTTKTAKLTYMVNDCTIRAMIAHPRHARVIAPVGAEACSLTTLIWTAPPSPGSAEGLDWAEIMERDGPPTDAGVIDQDLAMIIYTSGTTGRPKGVMLTHLNVVSTANSIATYLENKAEDIVCCVLPLAFSYGLYQMFVMALVGHTLLLEKSFAYPIEVLRRMERYGVTGFAGVPGMYASILQLMPSAGVDLSAVRYMTNAAGPLSAAHIEQLCELLPDMKFYSMHGQTECARTCYMNPDRLRDKPGSVGRAMPNSELYLVDEDGIPVGPNVVGEMVVRGANVMRGYWKMPEATAQKLRDGPIPGEKVLFTGDLFRADEDGDLFFVSRMDDIIKCRGEKVSPKEVEDILYQFSAVAEAAVVGVDDRIDGQAIKAHVVLRTGMAATEAEIRRHCRERLESHMVPKFVEFCDALPKTDSGKIKRMALTPRCGAERDLEDPGALDDAGD